MFEAAAVDAVEEEEEEEEGEDGEKEADEVEVEGEDDDEDLLFMDAEIDNGKLRIQESTK